MTYEVYPLPVLGPCRCAGCGDSLWWAVRPTRRLGLMADRAGWRESDGALHRCPNLPGRIELSMVRRTRPHRPHRPHRAAPPKTRYQCAWCSLAFSRAATLRAHLALLHPEPVGAR